VDDGSRAILSIARGVLADLDLEAVLQRVLEAARGLTDARYAALGVLDESRTQLSRFLTVGIDERARARIGPLPTGRGVLGELIRDAVPLRLADVGATPTAFRTATRRCARSWGCRCWSPDSRSATST
jgi:hypothetical protein